MSNYRDENPASGCWAIGWPLIVAIWVVVAVVLFVIWRWHA